MKKTSRVTLVFCVLSVIVLLFVSCGNNHKDEFEQDCIHEEVIDPQKPATCTETGLSEGKHCSVCNKVLVEQVEIPAIGHTEEIIAPIEAKCAQKGSTEGKKCVICGEITVKPKEIASLGHTTTTGTCERCNMSFGDFTIEYYVDEFRQPTTEGYVINKNYIEGTFSNSATTNSKLYVRLLADSIKISFFLYEYGTYPVKNSSTKYVDEYDITIKTAYGKTDEIYGCLSGDRLNIYDKTVLNALKNEKEVSFYIAERESTTTYLFTVDTSNFKEEYEKLFD